MKIVGVILMEKVVIQDIMGKLKIKKGGSGQIIVFKVGYEL